MGKTLVALVFVIALADQPIWPENNVWTKIGLEGINIAALVVDPTNPSTVYAGAEYPPGRAGLFKSTDGGANWFTTSGPPAFALAINPQKPSTIYAAGSRGVFKSTDSGQSWLDSGLTGARVLAIDASNPRVVYAGTDIPGDVRVYKTTDEGQTWIGPSFLTDPSLPVGGCGMWYIQAVAVDPHNANVVYAATAEASYCDIGGFFWKSTDAGITWHRMLSNVWVQPPIMVDPQNVNRIFVGQFGGVARSTNGGDTWTIAKLPIAPTAIAIDPRRSSTLYAAGFELSSSHPSQVWKSIDGGETWRFSDYGLSRLQYFRILTFNSNGPKTLYAVADDGVFKIDDAPSLSLDSAQYCIGDSWKLKVSNDVPNTSIRLLGTSNGNSWEIRDWRKTDSDGSWSEAGSFTAGGEGSHFLRVDIDGAPSNVVSFVVSKCKS